jgi:molybdopterin-guanine dinucleotide biosynthesis protein A
MSQLSEDRTKKPPCVILAGGLATRMGGVDKCLLPLGRSRIIDHTLARLKPQCDAVALNANGPVSRLAEFGLPVLPDSVAGHPGPLAGILAALDWAAAREADAVLTVAGDTPFLPADLVARLQGASTPGGMAIAASPDEDGTLRRHPTVGLWPVMLREDLRNALEDGVRKVGAWAGRHEPGIAVFEATPFDPFFNVNAPEDLATAEQFARDLI